ncbi:MAG: PorV/PorQ family protein [Ignavibacteriales bacterium]|nr:PorV/PorQ family protein [Ignavibacteriales bacterium]
MKRIIYLSIILLIATLQSPAGDEKRMGTTGAEELLIPVGARSIATAGSFLSTLKGVEAIYYNPAGLSAGTNSEAMFSYMSYIADINVSYFAVSANLEDIGAFGLSFKSLDFGDILQTTVDDPEGTAGNTYSPGYYNFGLTYSRSITDRVSAGVTTKMIYESIMNTSASALAIDMGIQYRFASNLSLGVAIKNIGSDMKFIGSDLQTKTEIPGTGVGTGSGVYSPETEPFQIPAYFELGLNYQYSLAAQNDLLVGSTFRNNNAKQDEIKLGLEYLVLDAFALRSGYEMLIGENTSSIFGLNYGVGVEQELESGMRFSFDYAFRSVEDFPTDNHVFTIKLGF